MANPRELVEAERTLPAHQDKNAIINGSFQINQRGDIDTAPVVMINANYQIDRFRSAISIVSGTIERLLNQTVNGKLVNTVKCVATSTASGSIGIVQPMETLFNNETKTFGAWIRSNNANARLMLFYGASFYSSSAHSGNSALEFLSFDKTIPLGATSLQCLAKIASATNGVTPIDSGDYIESTMWQLENGVRATPFEQRLIGAELSLCQRYYEKFGASITHYASGGNATGTLSFKATKRIIPTISENASAHHLRTANEYGVDMETDGTSGIHRSLIFIITADAEL